MSSAIPDFAIIRSLEEEVAKLTEALHEAGDGDTWEAAWKRVELELEKRTAERDAARDVAQALYDFGRFNHNWREYEHGEVEKAMSALSKWNRKPESEGEA